MKKIWYAVILVGLLAWFLSSSPDPVGTYVAKHHKNTIDTIFILKGGTYKQGIYRKADGVRLFCNEGKWLYTDGYIQLSNFFQGDDIARRSNYNYTSVVLTFVVPLERNFIGRPVFDYDEEATTYRYYKVLW